MLASSYDASCVHVLHMFVFNKVLAKKEGSKSAANKAAKLCKSAQCGSSVQTGSIRASFSNIGVLIN